MTTLTWHRQRWLIWWWPLWWWPLWWRPFWLRPVRWWTEHIIPRVNLNLNPSVCGLWSYWRTYGGGEEIQAGRDKFKIFHHPQNSWWYAQSNHHHHKQGGGRKDRQRNESRESETTAAIGEKIFPFFETAIKIIQHLINLIVFDIINLMNIIVFDIFMQNKWSSRTSRMSVLLKRLNV